MATAEETVLRQTVRGVLDLSEVRELAEDLRVKIAIARDCRILQSRVYELEAGQKKLEYELAVDVEGDRPMGVRVIAGPDVDDERLRSTDHHDVWVSAARFDGGTAKVALEIPERLYLCWLRCCRTYTLRGRVVCRKWVWDPREQRFVVCEAPVRGAVVKASDVDRFWWWFRRDEVGSDTTDVNGNFEITFRWCCWWWRPWYLKDWRLDPRLVERIQELLATRPSALPVPRPDPTPDFGIFQRVLEGLDLASGRDAIVAPGDLGDVGDASFTALGDELVTRLPEARDLRDLRVWPWYPLQDCRPDIVFKVTQDCGDGDVTIYTESVDSTRWNVPNVVDGITLVASDDACCGPFCCTDRPDHDCLVVQGVGCGGYPVDVIEQDVTDALAGYAFPGVHDRPFGGTIRILGDFGELAGVDFYKLQSRRLSAPATGWADVPADQVGAFNRGHWTGTAWDWETVSLQPVDGQQVLKSANRFLEEHPGYPQPGDPTYVDPANGDRLTNWVTASIGHPSPGVTHESPNLADGLYELRVIGYRYDEASDKLIDPKVMALCPPPGQQVDPAAHATIRLRLDNRVMTSVPGSVHLSTDEPDCDFPNVCAVVKNEDPAKPLSQQEDNCVDPCGVVRVSAGDTLTIHFQATDADGHLGGYTMTAHWAESEVFNVLAAGTLAGDPTSEFGPTYAQAVAQGATRPHWAGGRFKVTVPVGAFVPGNPHDAFETCCAYQLRLRVWKRTTNGCSSPVHFHNNLCEFAFTLVREDLIGDPNHPACSELCPDEQTSSAVAPEAGPVR